jgi:hypothetical protein
MENKLYFKRENVYQQIGGGVDIVNELPVGIYRLHYDQMKDDFSLELLQEKFGFEFKLYGLDTKFVNHVIGTYNNQEAKHNIGILLNGEKGAGKTVTAKYLCNELHLPVIICDANYKNIDMFISSIDQDCVFFFDEFEKNFQMRNQYDDECAGQNLLSVMDGLNNAKKTHIFVLTTNNKYIDGNLMSRPSRIRYIKEFESILHKQVVIDYLNDNLKYKQYFDDIMNLFSKMETITMDILKCVVDEVNMHNCPVSEFESIFNFTEKEHNYYGVRYDFQCVNEKDLKKNVDYMYKSYSDKETNYYNTREISFSKPFERLVVGDTDYYDREEVYYIDFERHIVVMSSDGLDYTMYILPYLSNRSKKIGEAEKSWIE